MTWSRSTQVIIDLEALRENFCQVRQRVPVSQKILSVVKSNAYGHGAIPVAQTLVQAGTEWLGVGTIDEGIELRAAGIQVPILILLGDLSGGFEELHRYQLTPAIHDQ